MKKGIFCILLISMFFLFIIGTGCQDSGNVAVTGKIGTMGPGGDLTLGLATDINARVGINMLDYDWNDREYDDIEYDLDIDFRSVSGLLDWHIFDDSFRITGGIYSINHDIRMDARPERLVQIGSVLYTPTEVGTLIGKVDYDGLSPYIGVGWGNPMQSRRRWGFTCDLGVVFMDSPDVTLCSRGGTLSNNAVFLAELEKERRDIEDDWDSLKYYPVISVGLFIRF